MYTLRKVLASVFMMIASLFKILMMVAAPEDLKDDFKDMV